MTWLWIAVGVLAGLALLAGLAMVAFHRWLCYKFMGAIVRVFEEKPLFIVPRGQPVAGAEDVRFPAADGRTLHGCYLRSTAQRRQGVVLFGLEFGSNCWACVPYCEQLLANGFDVFTFESRGVGASEKQPGYEPLQWVTNYEVMDAQAALAYLKGRPDADPRGVGFFGISKGAGSGLLAAARDPYVRCFVTDGVFATYTTMVPYMQKWIAIYSDHAFVQRILPRWFYGWVGCTGLRRISRERGCRFPHLERAMSRLAPRPLLMIHGGGDTYIKPEMARDLFALARAPKELWVVEGAKHNQALHTAGDEYRSRVLDFFRTHLAGAGAPAPAAERNGHTAAPAAVPTRSS